MIYYNGSSNPQNVYFNGTSLNYVYFNGTLVWSRSSTPSGTQIDNMSHNDYDNSFGIPSGFSEATTSALAKVTRANGRIDYYRNLSFSSYYVETTDGEITANGAMYTCSATIEFYWSSMSNVGSKYSSYIYLLDSGSYTYSTEEGFPSITWYYESQSINNVSVTMYADLVGMSVIDPSRLTTRVYSGKLFTSKTGKYIRISPQGDEYAIYTKTTGLSFQGNMYLYTTFTSA